MRKRTCGRHDGMSDSSCRSTQVTPESQKESEWTDRTDRRIAPTYGPRWTPSAPRKEGPAWGGGGGEHGLNQLTELSINDQRELAHWARQV